MSVLGRFIANDVPKMNQRVAEGFTYHELKDAMTYVDNKVRYVELDRTKTHLKYLGCRMLTPRENLNFRFRSNQNRPFDVVRTNNFYVEYEFQYADEEEPRTAIFALPLIERGNIYTINEKNWLVMPTIMDKVISVGDSQIFVDVYTAKYTFDRLTHTIIEGDQIKNVSVVKAEVYTNQANRLAATTNAKPTMIHYLLGQYGYEKTMELTLGFVPTPVLDVVDTEGKVVYRSRQTPPTNYFGLRNNRTRAGYKPNQIKFVVDEALVKPEVTYIIGNLLYILDHFPNSIDLLNLESTTMWRLLLGEIIHSGEYSANYLTNSMDVHFNGFLRPFDTDVISDLKDLGIEVTNTFELMTVILSNYNSWIARSNGGSLYYNKSINSTRNVLSRITNCFNRLYLDVYKEEMKNGGKPISPETLTSLFRKQIKTNIINGIRYKKLFVQISEDSTDHLYFKGTSFINKQDGNSVNVTTGSGGTKYKLTASAGTVGSLTYLSKKNTDPCVKVNPWVTLDEKDNTILPDPVYKDIVAATEPKLMITHTTSRSLDITDGEEIDVEDDMDYSDDDYYSEDFDDGED